MTALFDMDLKPRQPGGPIQRWTAAWARRLVRRLLMDPEYRQRAIRRGLSLLLTGRLDADGRSGQDRDAARYLAACAELLPESLRGFVEPRDSYDAWLSVNSWRPQAERALRQTLLTFDGRLPKVSFITPVYNTDPGLLAAMVSSVRAQVHEDWELCLLDDASTSLAVWPCLQSMADLDKRIRIKRLDTNGGISVATNAAVEIATGEILAFLDHDDLITPDCAAELAMHFAAHTQVDVVYSDDDKIGGDGRRFAPQFKPDWSPTLLLSHMYFGHIFSVRRRLFLELGGFRSDFDGAQDYDFALRASRLATGVGHIPKILYHWRTTPGSTALSGEAKPSSLEAGRRALEGFVRDLPGHLRAVHPDWAKAIGSGYYELEAPSGAGSDVALILDGPTSETADAFAEVVTTLPHSALSARLNAAARRSTSELMLFLDGGCAPPDWRSLETLVTYLQASGLSAVGPKQIDGRERVLFAGNTLDPVSRSAVGLFQGFDSSDPGPRALLKTPRECSYLGWNGLLIRRSAFLAVGGFDADAFPSTLLGEDLTARLRANGGCAALCPGVTITETRPRPLPPTPETQRFRNRHGDLPDPYYSPNLAVAPARFAPWPYCPPDRSGPLRIGVFTHNLQHEGAPNTLLDLVVTLKRTGNFDAVVFSQADGPLRLAFEKAGIDVEIIQPPPHDGSPARHAEVIRTLSKRLVELACDAVLANTLMSYYGVIAAVEAGLGALWWQHESEPWSQYFDYLDPRLRPFAYAAFGAAYRVVYVAESTRAIWRPVETRNNFMVVPHGIPAERRVAERDRWRRAEARSYLAIPDDEVVVLITGTICARKGQRDLIAALKRLPTESCTLVRVFIVGAEGEVAYGRALREDRADLPDGVRDRVTVTGVVEDISLYYRAADIFLCASKLESAPRVILEAMNFGLAIVTTPVNGISDIVEPDKSALFFSPGDPDELANHLNLLIENPELRNALARGAEERLAVLPSFENMFTVFEGLLQQARRAGAPTARPGDAFGS